VEQSSLERQRAILRFGLFGLLIVSPLPFGAVQPWAVLGLEIWAACLAGFSVWILRSDGALANRAQRLLVFAGLLLGIGVFQLIPAFQSWTRVFASRTQGARSAVGGLVQNGGMDIAPLSLEPPASVDALLRLATYVMIGVSAAVAIRKKEHLRQAAVVIAMCGALNALYGSAEYLSGHQHVLWHDMRIGSDEASGTFINRNHFAAYLAMTLPMALGLVLGRSRRGDGSRHWRERILELTGPAGLITVSAGVAIGLIWIGVILSYSRAGLAVALFVTAIVLAANYGGWRRRAIVALLIVPVAWLLLQDVRAPGERFVTNAPEISSFGGRLPVWESSVRIIDDYPVLGTGFGTFESAFVRYRPPGLDYRWDFAHNDWLQFFVEGGLVGGGAALAVLWMCLGPGRWASEGGRPALLFCGTSAIAGIAVQSLVDFGWRIPAVAVLTAFLIGATSNVIGNPPRRARFPRH
jgi:O-antigen ligase